MSRLLWLLPGGASRDAFSGIPKLQFQSPFGYIFKCKTQHILKISRLYIPGTVGTKKKTNPNGTDVQQEKCTASKSVETELLYYDLIQNWLKLWKGLCKEVHSLQGLNLAVR